jgi:hypothetical protein
VASADAHYAHCVMYVAHTAPGIIGEQSRGSLTAHGAYSLIETIALKATKLGPLHVIGMPFLSLK